MRLVEWSLCHDLPHQKLLFFFSFFPGRSVDPHMYIKVLCFSFIFQLPPPPKTGWAVLPVGWERCFAGMMLYCYLWDPEKVGPMSDVTQSINLPWSVFVLKLPDITHSFKKIGHHRDIHPSSCSFRCRLTRLLQSPHLVTLWEMERTRSR